MAPPRPINGFTNMATGAVTKRNNISRSDITLAVATSSIGSPVRSQGFGQWRNNNEQHATHQIRNKKWERDAQPDASEVNDLLQ